MTFDASKPVSIDNLPECCGDLAKYRHTCKCPMSVVLLCVMWCMEKIEEKERG